MKSPRKPPARHAETATNHAIHDASRLISHEEKHELIRAHAATRRQRPQGYGLGYYIGVAASCLVVATGWLLTMNHGIWQTAKQDDPISAELTQSAEQIRSAIVDTNVRIENARKQFDQAKNATSTR